MTPLQRDLYRYAGTATVSSGLKYFFQHPGFRFMCLKRFCESTSVINPAGIFVRLWYKRMQVKYGYQIPHTCKIGGGLFLGHYGNIVFNQGAVLGTNCNIAQGVTIGRINIGDKAGSPTLGDRVWVGTNAVIVGKIKIGNNALIAPLSFVNFDVPENALVLGNPATIVNYSGSAGYVNNIAP